MTDGADDRGAGEGGGKGRIAQASGGDAGLRYRHDGFTPARQRSFLEALTQTGCVEDACRAAGISDTSAYRTRRKCPDFARRWNIALAMAATSIDMIAFERATIGADKTIIRDGKVVQIERRPSDVILRAMMQNAARGREATARAALKKELERELYLERLARDEEDKERLAEKIMAKVRAVHEGRIRNQGYSRGPNGELVPPGYRRVEDGDEA